MMLLWRELGIDPYYRRLMGVAFSELPAGFERVNEVRISFAPTFYSYVRVHRNSCSAAFRRFLGSQDSVHWNQELSVVFFLIT